MQPEMDFNPMFNETNDDKWVSAVRGPNIFPIDKETWLQELGVDDFPTNGLDGTPLIILVPLRFTPKPQNTPYGYTWSSTCTTTIGEPQKLWVVILHMHPTYIVKGPKIEGPWWKYSLPNSVINGAKMNKNMASDDPEKCKEYVCLIKN